MQAYTCNCIFSCLVQLSSVRVVARANTAYLQYLKLIVDIFQMGVFIDEVKIVCSCGLNFDAF